MLKNIDNRTYELLKKLVMQDTSYNTKINIIDEITNNIIEDLEKQFNLNNVRDLIECGILIQDKIQDENIRKIGCWSD